MSSNEHIKEYTNIAEFLEYRHRFTLIIVSKYEVSIYLKKVIVN